MVAGSAGRSAVTLAFYDIVYDISWDVMADKVYGPVGQASTDPFFPSFFYASAFNDQGPA